MYFSLLCLLCLGLINIGGVNSVELETLYRYYHGGLSDHFYTTNVYEGTVSGYTFEGNVGELFKSQVGGSVPLYRFYKVSGGSGNHFYTTNLAEGNGWSFEGITGYIATSATSTNDPDCLTLQALHRFYNGALFDHLYSLNQNEVGAASGWSYEGVVGYTCDH